MQLPRLPGVDGELVADRGKGPSSAGGGGGWESTSLLISDWMSLLAVWGGVVGGVVGSSTTSNFSSLLIRNLDVRRAKICSIRNL